MAEENITTKFQVDISDLKANIQEANRYIRLANSEFKNATAGMDGWSSSADGLSAKTKQLNTVLQAHQVKLAQLQIEYDQVVAEQGENSKAAQDLQVKINNQEAAVKKTAAQLDKYTNELNSLQSESTQSESALQSLNNTIDRQEKQLSELKAEYKNVALSQGETSSEAQALAAKISSLNNDLQANKQKLNEVDQAAEKLAPSFKDVSDEAKDSGGGFTIMKGALADLISGGIQFGIQKVGEFVGALFEMSEATEEYRSMMAKIEGSSNSFGYSVDFAKGKYQDFYAYLGDDQAATNAITNLMGMKVSTETVSSAADAAIAVWSAYGDSIPIEGLTESINESAQVAQVTGSLADTINWAKRSNEDWTAAMAGHSKAQAAFNKAIKEGESQEDAYSAALAACSDTQERADLIAQTLNTTYGKSKETYDQVAGSITEANRAELELKDTQAELGETMQPVNTAITNLKNKALDAVKPVVESVAKAFLDLNDWLGEHPAVAKAATAAVGALAVAFGILAGALAIQALINGVTKAMQLLNLTALGNPWVLAAAAIAGFVTAILYLWNNCEGFREFFTNLWEEIKTTVSGFVDVIVNFFTVTIPEAFNGLITWFSQLPGAIGTWLANTFGGIVTWGSNLFSKAVEIGANFVSGIITWFSQLPGQILGFITSVLVSIISWGASIVSKAGEIALNFLSSVVSFFSQLPGKIWSFLSDIVSKVVSWGSQIVSKGISAASNMVLSVANYIAQLPGRVWTSLTNVISNVVSWGSSLVSKAASAASQMASAVINGISSLPSQVMSIGKNIVSGIWNGISGAAGWLTKKIKNFASNIVDGIKGFFGIKSPSRVMRDQVGKFLPAGIGEGIKANTKAAVKQVKAMSSRVLSEASKMNDQLGIQQMKANLTAAAGTLKSKVSSGLQRANDSLQQTKEIVFNQYNNSPKALSRIDLYRQTKTQLIAGKEKLKYV